MLTRRRLFAGALAALPLALLWRRTSRADGFGPLVPDPDGILDLPAGFSYRIVDRKGQTMTDGYRVPGRPDGMACFPGAAGTLVLLRNHELSRTDVFDSPYALGQSAPPQAFDAAELGGVTRVVVDATTGERRASNLVLVGTTRNCAGGTSPWGWLSCEETKNAGHGYVFACAPDAETVQAPVRIPAYGRFNHEAATVDPATMIAYLTEDEGQSALYRFVPADPSAPFVGRLQALRIGPAGGTDSVDTGTGHATGTSWAISWVDVDDPDPATGSVRAQAFARGAAIVRRGEGLWLSETGVYFASTNGGPAGRGQIFHLTPDGDGGELTLVAQSEGAQVLDAPDNICVAPWGDVYMAEDGGGDQYVRILHADGSISDFARNAASGSELAGVCFSPDGAILFVNIQGDGITVAITGPFPVAGPEDPPPDDPPPDGGPEDPPPDGDDGSPDNPGDDGPGGGAGCRAAPGDGALGTVAIAAAAAAALARTRA